MNLTHREIWTLSSAAGRWSPGPECLAWKQCLCLPGRFGHQNVQSCDSWWRLWDVPYHIWSLEELGTKGISPNLLQRLRLKVNHIGSRQSQTFSNFGHQSLQVASLFGNAFIPEEERVPVDKKASHLEPSHIPLSVSLPMLVLISILSLYLNVIYLNFFKFEYNWHTVLH